MKPRLAIAILALVLSLPAAAQEARQASSGDERRYVGEPIDLSLRDADLVETLRSFAEIGGFNLVLQPGIEGKVTVELKQVPWDLALEQILKVNNLGMEVIAGQRHIGTRADLAAVHERLAKPSAVRLTLRYADAAAVARALRSPEAGLLGTGESARAEPGNELVLRATGRRLLDLGRLLAEIDRPTAAGEDPQALEERCLATWRKLREE